MPVDPQWDLYTDDDLDSGAFHQKPFTFIHILSLALVNIAILFLIPFY